jgi:penicillin-binding protein 1A
MAITIKQKPPVPGRTGNGPPRGEVAAPLQPLLLLGVMFVAGILVALTLLPIFSAVGSAAKRLEDRLGPINVNVRKLFPQAPQRSIFLSADNHHLATVYVENRKVVSIDQVSWIAKRAILAIEDYQFFQHGGIDLKAIVRAAIANLKAGHITQGGSTITQQLVKNETTHKADTFIRKYREAQIANAVERVYTKKQVLELYLNKIFLGNGTYGIEAAAEQYFSKRADELNLTEGAMIAGLIANPSIYDPVSHPGAALRRRNVVLNRMAEIGWIPEDKAAKAESSPLGISKYAGEPLDQRQPFFVQFVRKLIEQDPNHEFAESLGKTPQERVDTLYAGGLHIYTTLDPAWQHLEIQTLRHWLPKKTDPQGAIATVQPGTGAVQALVSGRNFAETNLDLVTGLPGCTKYCGRHQTGSSFKLFTLAAAFREGIPPGQVYSSRSPVDLSEPCNGWKPNNAEGPGDMGYIDLYTATADSINVVFGQLAADVGPPNIARAAEDLGISPPLPSGPEDCSITLGTGDTSPLDMATAYAAIANNGKLCPYYAVERITGPSGKLIYQHDPEKACHQAVNPGIAHQITDMLKGVVAYGTGTNAQIGRPQAGKTGTNEEYKDAWFVGYVPQEATAIWIGYPGNPRPMYNVEGFDHMFGGDIPALMWHDIMLAITKGLPATDFPKPPPPPTGTIPSVVGKPQDQALKVLAKANFSGIVDGEAPSNSPVGTVIGQSPGGGTETTLGTLVHLTVSNGLPPKAKVPDVSGLDVEKAKLVIAAAGFNVSVLEQPVSDKAQDGIVLAQSPQGGKKVLAGSTVVLTVGHFDKHAPTPSPSPSPEPSPTKKPNPHPTKTK